MIFKRCYLRDGWNTEGNILNKVTDFIKKEQFKISYSKGGGKGVVIVLK